MKKLPFAVIALLAAAAWSTSAHASVLSVINSQFVTFTNVDSNEGLGSAINENRNGNFFAGGFTATHVSVEGTLTEVQTATFASEADISITLIDTTTVVANGSTTTGYTGTLVSPETLTLLATPTDQFGNNFDSINMEFFESFSDGAGTDQTWDTVTIGFQEISVIDGNFSLGTLNKGDAADGPGASGNAFHSNVAGGLDFFEFTLGEELGDGFLNIQTFDPVSGDTIDTEIALFDSSGVLLAFDDDGQATARGGLYSALSFGASDALAGDTDADPGEDGDSLAAGDYTLVVGGFDTNFEDLTIGQSLIGDVVAGTSAGDYQISFVFGVPEPSSIFVLSTFGLLALQRRRNS